MTINGSVGVGAANLQENRWLIEIKQQPGRTGKQQRREKNNLRKF